MYITRWLHVYMYTHLCIFRLQDILASISGFLSVLRSRSTESSNLQPVRLCLAGTEAGLTESG